MDGYQAADILIHRMDIDDPIAERILEGVFPLVIPIGPLILIFHETGKTVFSHSNVLVFEKIDKSVIRSLISILHQLREITHGQLLRVRSLGHVLIPLHLDIPAEG